MHPVVLLTSLELSVVRIKTERLFAKTQSWGRTQSRPVLFEKDTVALERTHVPHGQLFQLHIGPTEWSMGRRIESKKHETSLFLLSSESVRTVIATTDD